MEDNLKNLPPFYVGQKVVCIKSYKGLFHNIKEVDKYTITSILKYGNNSVNINNQKKSDGVLVWWLNARSLFVPIQEQKFPLIKLSKVIEKERVLVSSN